jgi:hypothetical protein
MTARRWPQLESPPSWAGRSLEERARGVEAACAAAIQLLGDGPDRARRLMQIDPVPASTRAIIRRLASGGDG